MSVFKVGQRVRKVAEMALLDRSHRHEPVPMGAQGTVLCPSPWGGYRVQFDGVPRLRRMMAYQLAPPLTDPRCSDFIVDMERFSSLNKVTA